MRADRVLRTEPTPDRQWTVAQKKFLRVLEVPQNRDKSVSEICRLAGYKQVTTWYVALQDERFAARVEELTGYVVNGHVSQSQEPKWSESQRKLLDVLEVPENRGKSITEICRLAGYRWPATWYRALLNERFATTVKMLTNRATPLPERVVRTLGPQWTKGQRKLLDVLEIPENRGKDIQEIISLAGYQTYYEWAKAIRSEPFRKRVEELTGYIPPGYKSAFTPEWTAAQKRFLDVLAVPENREKSYDEILQLAGYKSVDPWYKALRDKRFAARVEELTGYVRKGHNWPEHTEVTFAVDPDEELRKDVWDVRRLKADYPRHKQPCDFIANFTLIENTALRQQVKQYYRLHLPQWAAGTIPGKLRALSVYLRLLPAEVHIGNLNREHIELLVAHSGELGKNISGKGMRHVRAMLEFMATNSAWKGPRPPRFLIYPEDIPRNTSTLPRPILPDVIEQFDAWLDKAVAAMQSNEAPPLLHPMLWDALLILRRTGMRTEDLCHLKQPDTNGKNGCLEQDSAGDWWIRIDAKNHKMGKDHRIPTKQSDGTVEAIRRQVQRVVGVENHLGDWLLFRDDRGSLRYSVVNGALRKLSAHLSHEGRPYKISPHQFRHTIATDMIEMGVDPYTVKEFLGHESLEMTQKYIKVYLSTLKKRYDEYRSKRPPSFAAVITDNLAHAEISFGAEDDSGWEEGRVGKLYRSPLPNGMGVCKHLPMLDPCPTPPVCGFCSKLCVEKRHLPVWETALENHLRTKEILAQNSTANAKALERHTPYLEKARHIVETVRREGFYDGRIHNK